ncbi:MAG: hypothetical protein ACOX52_24545 [Verrucomicrobiota bacterium]
MTPSEKARSSRRRLRRLQAMVGTWPSQCRNNRVAAPGFSCPTSVPRPFDTESDSAPDPELDSPSTFSDSV